MIFRLLLFSMLLPSAGFSEITLAPLFSDHAILQRDKPLPVWGRATPREKIAVTFRDQTVNTTAGADGRWIVYLEPVSASAEPADLVIAGNETVTVRDVLVGDVWLASGQSNMEWPVSLVRPEEQKIAAVELPLVRQLQIAHTVKAEPADHAPTSGWQPASPASVGSFTAVGYFFAREIHRKTGVPIGIVNSSWGGTPIEAWMSEAALQATTLAMTIDARWQQAMKEWPPERVARYPADLETWVKAEEHAKATKTENPMPWPPPPATPDSQLRPTGLFNGMIAPLQPGALRGVLWYQGEANTDRPAEYAELLMAMIRTWRSHWNAGEGDPLPFYFVQLPNFADKFDSSNRRWARLRESQAKALALPATGMAVTIDIGDADEIHPTNKMEVGRRLALIAKRQVYDIAGDFSGPVFEKAAREGAAMRVHFAHADGGLIAHAQPVQSLELAGADKAFHPASARIDRDMLVVSSPNVKEPVAVRYAWTNAPVANLYNGAGLPAAPFRSDDW
jgi:sialate O-acetylesterase